MENTRSNSTTGLSLFYVQYSVTKSGIGQADMTAKGEKEKDQDVKNCLNKNFSQTIQKFHIQPMILLQRRQGASSPNNRVTFFYFHANLPDPPNHQIMQKNCKTLNFNYQPLPFKQPAPWKRKSINKQWCGSEAMHCIPGLCPLS